MKNIVLSTVIIDDEVNPILGLIDLLNAFSSINIVGTSTNLEEGVALIKATQPDIVFIDINMPGRSGLEIYDEFESPYFKIIFCTSNQHFTMSELRKSASGYLLKPVDINILHHILQKVYDELLYEQKLQK
jgi:two-component system LytT family response regulator